VTRVIIDTGISGATVGAAVDDGLALLAALRHDDVTVDGVIATGGDLPMKVAQIRRIFELAGRSALLGCGARHSLLGVPARDASFRPPTAGFLSKNRSVRGVAQGVDLLAEQLSAHPAEVTVLVLGQATTLALALLSRPHLTDAIARVIVRAGCIGYPYETPATVEDPHALAALMRLIPDKLLLVGRDVSDAVTFRAAQFEPEVPERSERGPIFAFVADYCDAWLRFHEAGKLVVPGALAVLAAAEPALFATARRPIALDPCNRSFPALVVPLDLAAGHSAPAPGAVSAEISVTTTVDVARARDRLCALWDLPKGRS
jgi:inosine-uridine nucleoside N-ribohydrolase